MSAAQSAARQTGVGFYFDTVVTVTLYGADSALLEDLWSACARYEGLLSKTIDTSDVARINRANGEKVTVDPETYAILREAREISEKSGGAFSMTIAPISAMWDFTGGTQRMPTEAERLAALPLVDDTAVELLEKNQVRLPKGAQIDLGGIAKGYIADQVADMVRARAAGATISLGGNTYVVGEKPSGGLWNVGIQDPNGQTGDPLLKVSLGDGTVVTSGVYERYFEKDGVRYHHILDPQTGSSAETDLVSATVVGQSSMAADALATACVVLGSEAALELLQSVEADGLLITQSGEVLTTPGFAERYQLARLK